jgi:hypothetical protein
MTNNLPVGQPGLRPKDTKYQPSKRDTKIEGNELGHASPFNIKGKVTSMGGDYHNQGSKSSGLNGNFGDKNASNAYLKERGKEGIKVRNFSGTNLPAEHSTGNIGQSAYNSKPIDQVYEPATSKKSLPPAAPIVYNKIIKQKP